MALTLLVDIFKAPSNGHDSTTKPQYFRPKYFSEKAITPGAFVAGEAHFRTIRLIFLALG